MAQDIPTRTWPIVIEKASEMDETEVLATELRVMRQQHRDLDDAITALEAGTAPDMLQIKRLKKQKLSLRDRMARIEDRLTPDIIA